MFAQFQVVLGIRTGGRLTRREINMIAAAGYQSYLSTAVFPTNDTVFDNVPGDFPATVDEMSLATSLGMQTFAIDASFNAADAMSISDALLKLRKPVYVHCYVGYSASLFTLLHLYRSGAVLAEQILPLGLAAGWDYQSSDSALALINSITGQSLVVAPQSINLLLTHQEQSYKSYYWPHRVGSDSWYSVGQLLSTQVNNLAAQGYKTVISMRADGESTTRLPSDPKQGPVNNNEFGDSQGMYSSALEAQAFQQANVSFVHIPVTGDGEWAAATFFNMVPQLQAAEQAGPVLAHCASGYRSGAYVSTYLAYKAQQCTAWALRLSAQIGYAFDVDADAEVVTFMQTVLKC
jgi:protein tyrosine phosphatase (PTP) superfamily phosphohydrolase (DUF442 family)